MLDFSAYVISRCKKGKEKFENQLLMSCSSFMICILQALSNDPVPHVRNPTKHYTNKIQICSSYRGIVLTSGFKESDKRVTVTRFDAISIGKIYMFIRVC
jgi:hypothetical protein